jgi:hypothetical protein
MCVFLSLFGCNSLINALLPLEIFSAIQYVAAFKKNVLENAAQLAQD